MSTQKIIHQLDLQPHPEGGWYRRNFTSPEMVSTPRGDRPTLTSIFYLLTENQLSRWHMISSTELWHFYKGALCCQCRKVDTGVNPQERIVQLIQFLMSSAFQR